LTRVCSIAFTHYQLDKAREEKSRVDEKRKQGKARTENLEKKWKKRAHFFVGREAEGRATNTC
jgi:hypothetical protein